MGHRPRATSFDPHYAKHGEIIRALRENRVMSVSQLARETGMKRTAIDGIEGGATDDDGNIRPTRRIDVIEMCKLADALNISHHELFDALTAEYRKDRNG